MIELSRIMVFNRLDAYVCDLDPARILELRSVEEINGEHALTIVTTHQLEKTNRIVLNDGMGIWHEYVITGIVDTHETDQGIVTEYYCVWSIQYDLSCTFVNDQYGCGIVPGHASVMHPARDGLTIALSTTNRWQIGTITVTSEAAASFYRQSGWEAIQTVLEKWGGELQATITVGQDGVVSRAVDLLAHVGASNATRRFDYGHDVASIKRTVSEDVWPCRIVPLGASQETDEGGYTRRPTIESVNDGVIWLQDDTAAPYTRVPDGNGGWEYPTMIVENDTYEEPADLKAWALANITDYTRPKVSYEASVVQLARAGMNAHGVALGDEVVIVDREFGGEGLRISARVVKQECNLLDPSDTVLTIGNVTDKLSSQLSDLSRQLNELAEQVSNASIYQSGAAWVSNLLSRINAEANATGGYFYYTEGQGVRCYDAAVSDPTVGAEASKVCEMRGGNIRIANSKTAQGDWEWKTVFISGRILAELIDAIGSNTGIHAQLTPTGLDVYDGANLLAHFGEEAKFYDGAGNKLLTIGAYSNTYHEGKLDFGSNIGFLSGRYSSFVDPDTEQTEYIYQMLLQAAADFEFHGNSINMVASGLDSANYGWSNKGARADFGAVRRWTSDQYREDRATFTAYVSNLGNSPVALMEVMSGGGITYFRATANNSHATATIGCDRLHLVDTMREPTVITSIFIRHGTVGQTESIAANGYRDYNVSFDHTFESAPNVQLTIYSTTSATTSFDCDIYLRSVSTTGFTARIINHESVARSPGFCWQAIG